jgi:alginate O-acetyltransferase complex protein AlgI
MAFDTPSFLFFFLPIFFLVYFLSKERYKKWLILLASLALYAWFQRWATLWILSVVLINYCILSIMRRMSERRGKSIPVLYVLALIFNVSILLFFKIFSTSNGLQIFIISKLPETDLFKDISFPFGLSFIIFQIISCLIDSHKSKDRYPKSIQNYVAYLLMFPKIILGPIARYNAIAPQLDEPKTSWKLTNQGAKRFIRGLAKKILIADQLASVVNAGFNLPTPGFPTSIAWLIIFSFFLQIYYDFSGYIDMGIGIAEMMGISLPENFNMPYLSRNISEFWRRWHMTLMAWYRDYIFYPLERRRRKTKILRQEINTILIFLLTGLWHGFASHYLIWGIFQGFVVVFENSKFGQWIKKIPVFMQHIYFLFITMMGWVMFRSPKVSYALLFYSKLFASDHYVNLYPYSVTQPLPIINNSVWIAFVVGIVCLLPIREWKYFQRVKPKFMFIKGNWIYIWCINLGYIFMLVFSLSMMATQTFVPSIYGKF